MMENNKKILIRFSIYLLTLLLIIIVGISNVFADTYSASQFDANLYDNYGPSLHYVTTTYTNNRWQGTIPTMTANSSGAAWAISSPVVLLSGHTYSLSAQISGPFGGNIRLSTYNRIGVGTSFYNAVTSYQNNTYVTENYSNVSYNILQFAFTPTTNGNYILFPFATTYTGDYQTFWLENIIIDDLGSSGGVSETTINKSLNNQTNILNNSIIASTNDITANSNSNRDTIINNQNSNKQAIIDNQNANNDALIDNDNANTEKQIESQKVCNDTILLFNDKKITGYLNSDGTIQSGASNWGITDYILVKKDSTITFTNILDGGYDYYNYCIYDKNKTLINCSHNYSEITTTSDNYYRFSIRSTNQPEIKISLCQNGNQALNDSLNGLNDSINDDDTGSANNDTASFITGFNTNTFGLTSIITAPLNLIQSLTSKSCTPLHLPLPYLNNKYLDLPCMSTIYSQHFGSFFTLYQTITYGIIAYWVCVRIFNHVKDFKNPEHDEIEVVDL